MSLHCYLGFSRGRFGDALLSGKITFQPANKFDFVHLGSSSSSGAVTVTEKKQKADAKAVFVVFKIRRVRTGSPAVSSAGLLKLFSKF